MLRSPWLGLLAVAIAGIAGYVLSNPEPASRVLEAVTVELRATRDSGAGWDFGGGLPDPRVEVERAGRTLATCEGKDVLAVTCNVGVAVDGPVRVTVIDVDSSDHDAMGTLDVAGDRVTGNGAVRAVDPRFSTAAAGAWQRFRPLWIALAIGLAIAAALAVYRRRHA